MSTIPPINSNNLPSYSLPQDTNNRPVSLPASQSSAPTVEVSSDAVQAVSSVQKQQALQADPRDLQDAAEKVQKVVQMYASELKFSVDEDLEIPVVKIINTANDEIIRQIPSEEMLEIAKSIDKIAGMFVNQTA